MIINPYLVSPSSNVPPDPSGPSPMDISGLQLWMKANNSQFAATSNNTQVATWNDASGNSRDATGVILNTTKPRLRLTEGPNSYPAICMVDSLGDGLGGFFTLPDFLTAFTSGDIFIVCKQGTVPTATSEASPPEGDWGTASDAYYTYFGDGKVYSTWGTNARKDAIDLTTGGTFTQTNWGAIEIRTASSAWSWWGQGIQKFSTGTNTVAWSTAPKIGRNTTTNNKYFNGWIAEMIFYNSVLSSSDRFNTVHTYLNNKYNLSLPTS